MTLEINNKFSQREYQRASSTTTTPASYIRCTHTLTSLRHVSPDVGLALSLPLSPPPFLHFSSPRFLCLKKLNFHFPLCFVRERKKMRSL
ncbi:hypothetical protein NC653_006729 [Populus alba x Populus x berolinensis]|uniref:Uncharacterized protein n=1 Tax=Populus alba x Populus x berolinensis TaxID=444605 RepID=A0AAD6RF00_9ROSI|nr:hypothetical protein NC653_006729 [Populus alba x Populus x berolinensis]